VQFADWCALWKFTKGAKNLTLAGSSYIASSRTAQKTPLPVVPPLSRNVFVASEMCLSIRWLATDETFLERRCLPSSCLAMDVFPGSVIPAFISHVTILSFNLLLGLPNELFPSGFYNKIIIIITIFIKY
jgi:hypothetical protein